MRRIIVAALLLASPLAWAHGPTRQKVAETITINAAPEAVWAVVKDFDKLQAWHPAVESSTATQGNAVDSERTLVLKGGGKVVEKLESWSEADRKFSYRMREAGPIPVSNYSSALAVKPGPGAGTTVVDVSLERVRWLRATRDEVGSSVECAVKQGLLGPQWQRPELYDLIHPRPLREAAE